MSLFEFLRPKPSMERFAKHLIAGAARHGQPGWRYVAEAEELHGPEDTGRISLTNMFLEYSNAEPSARSDLLEKYLSMMSGLAAEIPKLWSLAQKSIYPVIRSRRDMNVIVIRSRGEKRPFAPRVERPLHGDLVLRIVYDTGPATTPIGYEELETWGVSIDAVYERALQNLRSLEKPSWTNLESGVAKLASDVSYEESMLLREDVQASCPVRGRPVFMPINRGVLLAVGMDEPQGIDSLLQEATRSFENNPWPLAPVLLTKAGTRLDSFQPIGAAGEVLRRLQAVDLYMAYRDQQEALKEHLNKVGQDVFVATADLMAAKDDSDRLLSYAVWTEGVLTWLPKVDLLAFNKKVSDEDFETILVPWDAAAHVCSKYMKPLEEDPIRYHVDSFPDAAEWEQLSRMGERLQSS